MDKDAAQFIPPGCIIKTAGTWTPSIVSNVYQDLRSTAAAAFHLIVPVLAQSNKGPLKGAKLLSVELIYKIGTLAAVNVSTVELEKEVISSAGAVTGAAVTVTLNSAEDTTAKRKAVGTHRVIATLSTPAFIGSNEAYLLYVMFDCQATTVVTLYGAVANFEVRL
jgi:hypothetical protein